MSILEACKFLYDVALGCSCALGLAAGSIFWWFVLKD